MPRWHKSQMATLAGPPLLAWTFGKRTFRLSWQLGRMSRYSSPRHSRPSRRQRAKSAETTFQTARRYGFLAVASGLGIAFGANTWDDAQKRRGILEALPPGYAYAGCDDVRAAGVAPIYRSEPGFSARLDGDGDGVGCEPYRGR